VPEDTSAADRHLGRRTIVRAGATAAWTVPLIAVAAPAMAATCSGGTTGLTAVLLPGSTHQTTGNPKTLTFQVQVCDTGHSATCALSATATAPGANGKLTSLSFGSWAAATSTNGASSLTISAPADGQISAGGCATYNVTIKVKGGSGQLTLTFRTSNGGLAVVSLSVGDS
jgi:hypothetical protein